MQGLNDKKKRKLDKMLLDVAAISNSAAPALGDLGLSNVSLEAFEGRRIHGNLPQPLYVLYSQLAAANEVFGLGCTVRSHAFPTLTHTSSCARVCTPILPHCIHRNLPRMLYVLPSQLFDANKVFGLRFTVSQAFHTLSMNPLMRMNLYDHITSLHARASSAPALCLLHSATICKLKSFASDVQCIPVLCLCLIETLNDHECV